MNTLTKINLLFGTAGILGLMSLGVSYKLSVEAKLWKTRYEELYRDYNNLKRQCVIDNQQYKDKINELLKKSIKQPRVVVIPKVITKTIPVEKETCQNMVYLTEEFANEENNSEDN